MEPVRRHAGFTGGWEGRRHQHRTRRRHRLTRTARMTRSWRRDHQEGLLEAVVVCQPQTTGNFQRRPIERRGVARHAAHSAPGAGARQSPSGRAGDGDVLWSHGNPTHHGSAGPWWQSQTRPKLNGNHSLCSGSASESRRDSGRWEQSSERHLSPSAHTARRVSRNWQMRLTHAHSR